MRAIVKLTQGLHRRIMLMLGRAVLRLVDDAAGLQRVQVTLLAGEVRDGVERFQQYGFSAHPLAGAEALVVFIGGNRDHPIALAVDDRRHRLRDLQPGEVAVYTDEGDCLLFRRGGTVELKAASKVVVDSPMVEVNAETIAMTATAGVTIDSPAVTVTGTLLDGTAGGNGTTLQAMRDAYNAHTHGENDQGGQTDPTGSQM